MAGGIGSRFWPFSRQHHPKQFHDVLGTGRSLLQQTADRFKDICPNENIFIVTNRLYYDLVKEQLPYLSDDQILLEPSGRNTAPCLAYAAYKIAKREPHANMVVTPADHIILDEKEFVRIIKQGLDATKEKDILLTLGIKPSRPDTGYGYIQYLESDDDIKKVKTFTEKPHLELAQTFLDSGDFVWNAGIFIWNAKSVLSAFRKHTSDLHDIFNEGTYYNKAEKDFIETAYSQCKSISIDYAIMEKADNVYTLLSDFGWSDLGTWKSLYEVSDHQEDENVIEGNVMTYNTKTSIIKVPGDKLYVVEGLEDYIVAEYDGVVMICRKSEEQKVKEFVADVKSKQDKRFS